MIEPPKRTRPPGQAPRGIDRPPKRARPGHAARGIDRLVQDAAQLLDQVQAIGAPPAVAP
jgi:hypothetical protein